MYIFIFHFSNIIYFIFLFELSCIHNVFCFLSLFLIINPADCLLGENVVVVVGAPEPDLGDWANIGATEAEHGGGKETEEDNREAQKRKRQTRVNL